MKRLFLVGIVLTALVIPFLINTVSPASAEPAAIRESASAPDFELKDLRGATLRLSDLRGKVVVLNFWATWCPPCRHEIPWFVDLQKKYGSQGLQIVGISMDSGSPAEVERFAKRMGINYPLAMGDSALAARYGGVSALPSTFYIGRDGTVVRFVPGLVAKEEIERIVTAALAHPGRSSRGALTPARRRQIEGDRR